MQLYLLFLYKICHCSYKSESYDWHWRIWRWEFSPLIYFKFVWGLKWNQHFLSWCSAVVSSKLGLVLVLINRDSCNKNPPQQLISQQTATWVTPWEGSCDSLAFLTFFFNVADKHTRTTKQSARLLLQLWLASSLRFHSDSLRILFSAQTVS